MGSTIPDVGGGGNPDDEDVGMMGFPLWLAAAAFPFVPIPTDELHMEASRATTPFGLPRNQTRQNQTKKCWDHKKRFPLLLQNPYFPEILILCSYTRQRDLGNQ